VAAVNSVIIKWMLQSIKLLGIPVAFIEQDMIRVNLPNRMCDSFVILIEPFDFCRIGFIHQVITGNKFLALISPCNFFPQGNRTIFKYLLPPK